VYSLEKEIESIREVGESSKTLQRKQEKMRNQIVYMHTYI